MPDIPDPKRIFIKSDPEWSFNLIGSIKELVEPSPSVLELYYGQACRYLQHRHNFIIGQIDNVGYTEAMYGVFKPFEHDGILDAVTKYSYENLYRRVRPALDKHQQQISGVRYFNDDKGDVQGLIFDFVQHQPITTLQFS